MLVENRFRVGRTHSEEHGERFVVARPRSGAQLLTREEAVNLAAHLVAVADPVADQADGDGDYRFEDVLDAVVKERGE